MVIGAGSAGLAAAAALQRRGVPAVVLESGASVGASWRHRYEELQLNTLRWLSTLPDTRLPRTAGRWVTRDDYVTHLESFAARERLDVRFGVTVDRVDRAAEGWCLLTSAGDHPATQVVVATGLARVPHLPNWPGRDTYSGPVLHVAHLRRIAALAGQRVLVVGAGNSGVELAAQLVDAGATELWLSVRTPPTILPLEVFGIPLNPVGVALRYLPERVRDGIARSISRVVLGNLAPYGLPAPPLGPYARLRTTGVTVAVDRGFVRHLRAGRLEIVDEVEHLAGAEAVLRSGRRVRPDVIVLATGFRAGLEPLVGHLAVLGPSGRPLAGAGRPTPGAPGLWFVGYWPGVEGALRRHPLEARRIARQIAQEVPGADPRGHR